VRKLNEKIAIVTGGASGLGRSVSEKFAENGAKVAILDINLWQTKSIKRVETLLLLNVM